MVKSKGRESKIEKREKEEKSKLRKLKRKEGFRKREDSFWG